MRRPSVRTYLTLHGAIMSENWIDRFLAAVLAGDDDQAERLASAWCAPGQPGEEARLVGLASSANQDVRWWSIRALANARTPAAAAAVARTLADPNAEVRSVALMTLGHLHRRQPELVAHHLRAMADLLADDEGFVRQTAVESLALCGDDAVAVLAEVLDGPHDAARTRAAAALRKIGSMQSAPILFRHLNDANYLVHSYCYQALDEMGLLDNALLVL